MNIDEDKKLAQSDEDKKCQQENLQNESAEDFSMFDTVVMDMSHLVGSIAVQK